MGQATFESLPDLAEPELEDDSDLDPELPEEPFDELEPSEPDFEEDDSALAPDSDLAPEPSEPSDLPFDEAPLAEPARLSVR